MVDFYRDPDKKPKRKARGHKGGKIVKTTIGIRQEMMEKVHARMAKLDKEYFIDYIRDLIHLDLEYQMLGSVNPISLHKFRREMGWIESETAKEALERITKKGAKTQQPYYDPPRKYSGFKAGLRRWRVAIWFKKRLTAWQQNNVKY